MENNIKKFMLDNLNNKDKGIIWDLSKEALLKTDYDFIGHVITKSGCLKKLILPKVNSSHIKYFLKILNKATIVNSVLTEIQFSENLENATGLTKILYKQLQSRLNRNRNQIFGIHGAGNIGLGLMADIVAKSPFEYQIIGTSNDAFLRFLINTKNQYLLRHGSNNKNVTKIENVKIISREKNDIVTLYEKASILAVCLTPSALVNSANYMAQGLINRYRLDQSGLKIIVLMNMPNSAEFVKEKLCAEINSLAADPVEAQNIVSGLVIVPSVIDRIVTKIPANIVKSQIRKQFITNESADFMNNAQLQEQMDKIIENPDMLKEAIIKLNIHFELFNAEQSFAHYVPKSIPEIHRFPHMKSVLNFEQLETIKNKFINGPHAILAWLGSLKGCKTIAEAIKYPGIASIIQNMMTREIIPVLKSEYSDLTDEDLEFHKELFIKRCYESNEDPVTRVGRDPIRKIEKGGRIRGTLELCKKHSLTIPTHGLELGIAAAILYSLKNVDPDDIECQNVRKIYNRNNSLKEVLYYHGFDPVTDTSLVKNILRRINFLDQSYQTMDKRYSYPKPNKADLDNEHTSNYIYSFYKFEKLKPINNNIDKIKIFNK